MGERGVVSLAAEWAGGQRGGYEGGWLGGQLGWLLGRRVGKRVGERVGSKIFQGTPLTTAFRLKLAQSCSFDGKSIKQSISSLISALIPVGADSETLNENLIKN